MLWFLFKTKRESPVSVVCTLIYSLKTDFSKIFIPYFDGIFYLCLGKVSSPHAADFIISTNLLSYDLLWQCNFFVLGFKLFIYFLRYQYLLSFEMVSTFPFFFKETQFRCDWYWERNVNVPGCDWMENSSTFFFTLLRNSHLLFKLTLLCMLLWIRLYSLCCVFNFEYSCT